MKEALHASYLETMKDRHSLKPIKPTPKRRVLVIGSDRHQGNIGSAIAKRLSDNGYEVLDPPIGELDARNVNDWHSYFGSFPDTDTLVMANGYTYMDWIENYPLSEMERVVSSS